MSVKTFWKMCLFEEDDFHSSLCMVKPISYIWRKDWKQLAVKQLNVFFYSLVFEQINQKGLNMLNSEL